MVFLDTTIINVALPSIQHAMRLSGPELEWMVTAYAVPFGGLLLLGGRIGDFYGRRRVLLAGVVLFTAASLLGGLAQTPWWLLSCRAIQGTGAAVAFPATLALITATFPEGPQRERAIGTLNVIGGSGAAIGLLAGGLITTYLSWRWVMFVNVPAGVFLLAVIPRVMPQSAGQRGPLDVAGALSVTTGVVLLVYALITAAPGAGGAAHWGSPTVVACLVAGGALLLTFVAVERRSSRPLVPLRIFASRSRAGSYVVEVLLNSALFGVFFFMTLYVQRIWGYGPLRTAIVYLPVSGMIVAGTWAGSRLVARFDARLVLIGGLACAAAGFAWLSRIGESGNVVTSLLGPCLLAYAGIGLTIVPVTLTGVSGVAESDAGLAAGLFSAARQVGGATGLAVLGTVTWTTAAAQRALAGHTSSHALAVGIERGFLAAGALAAAAALAAAGVIPRHGRPPGRPEPRPAGAARAVLRPRWRGRRAGESGSGTPSR